VLQPAMASAAVGPVGSPAVRRYAAAHLFISIFSIIGVVMSYTVGEWGRWTWLEPHASHNHAAVGEGRCTTDPGRRPFTYLALQLIAGTTSFLKG
jgi:hypothetical protein